MKDMVSLINNIKIKDRKIKGEAINIGIKISFHNGKSIDKQYIVSPPPPNTMKKKVNDCSLAYGLLLLKSNQFKVKKFFSPLPQSLSRISDLSYIPNNTGLITSLKYSFNILKVKHIKTYYSNFMGNADTLYRGKYIPLTPHSQVSEADPVNYTTFRTGIDLKIAKKCLIYLCLNIGVTTQTILGFVICKNLWDESISNDSNYLCSKPSHIIKCLNIGGSYGYIS